VPTKTIQTCENSHHLINVVKGNQMLRTQSFLHVAFTRFAILCMALCLLTTSASADQVTLGAERDTSIFSDFPSNSNGAGVSLFSGNTGSPESRRALIVFDLIAAGIPNNAIITNVELTLNSFRNGPLSTSTDVYNLFRLTQDWGEAGSDAGSQGGTGAPAQPGDATWEANFFGQSLWNNPGGDFSNTISASQTVGLVTPGNMLPVTWSGAGLVADVQDWLGNPGSNFGWILMADTANSERSSRIFGSRERSVGSPELFIEYTVVVPEPNCAGCIALYAFSLVVRRRRSN
jgi:hypothetical protein